MEFNNNKGEVEFPYEITPVDPEVNEELLKYFTGEGTGFVQVGPEKYFFPSKYKDEAAYMYNFEARHSDIWVATFPRSGTTWTQELVWMIANNLDYEGAQQEPLTKRFPFFEFSIFMHDKTKNILLNENKDEPEKQNIIREISKPMYTILDNVYKQRFIKTHFPFSLLPPSVLENGAKVVYIARNPRNVAVSYYHLNRLYRTQGYIGDFQRYWYFFERNLNPWMPYWKHIEEGWEHRNHPNVLFMFYEDMNKDLPSTIRKVAKFLNKTINDDEVTRLASYLSIENFKNNPAVNGEELMDIGVLKRGEQSFVRKGKIGECNEEFTPELRARADKWINNNLKKLNITFPEQFYKNI